jgi:cytochrome b561
MGDLLQQVHEGLNVVLMLTLGGHIVAAIWHHLVLKDDTLKRMIVSNRS